MFMTLLKISFVLLPSCCFKFAITLFHLIPPTTFIDIPIFIPVFPFLTSVIPEWALENVSIEED